METIWGIKLKLCWILLNISLYKNIVFYCCCLSNLVAMPTLNFHIFIMGKMKIAFIAISLKIFIWKLFLEMFVEWWLVLYQTYTFCLNFLIWLVVMATKRLNLQQQKINSSEDIWGIKLRFCRIFQCVSFCRSFGFYCYCPSSLVSMSTLSFHWLIIGKLKIGIDCYLITALQIFL